MKRSRWCCAGVVSLVFVAGLGVLAAPCTITVQPGASIQAAIDAASPGDVICLAEGEWEEHLTVARSLTLRGVEGTTTIRGHKADDPVIRVLTPGEDAVVASLESLAVTGGRGIGGHGLRVEGAVRLIVELSSIYGNSATGIFLRGSGQATIKRSTLAGNARGIVMHDSVRAVIASSNIEDDRWRAHGIYMVDSAKASIMDSSITTGGSNIFLGGDARATVERSILDGAGTYGIIISGSSQAAISSSSIKANDGVLITGSSQATIRDSGIRGKRFVIRLLDSARVAITGSTMTGGGGDHSSIRMDNSAQASITDSTIEGSRGNGVHMTGSTEASILDTLVQENLGQGIRLGDSARATIMNSAIVGNGGSGIQMMDSALLVLEETRVIGNGGYGVGLYSVPCFTMGAAFRGNVRGKSNHIPGPDEEDGNQGGAVCPDWLDFLRAR